MNAGHYYQGSYAGCQFLYCNAECRYAKCRYGECLYTGCRGTLKNICYGKE
jgi:hypothetical protein